MNPTNPQLCSPEDLSLMFDIYGEELKNSNFFSTPSQSKSPQEQVFCFEEPEEEKKMIEDKENLYQPTVITPYKLRNQLLRSPLYDITPCPKTKKKDSCNVTPVKKKKKVTYQKFQ